MLLQLDCSSFHVEKYSILSEWAWFVAAEYVKEFVEQNLLPLVSPINGETLRPVKEDGRPIVVAVLESETTTEGKHFIKKLKMAAPAYRKFVFAYVVAPEWPEFLRPFNIKKDTALPTVFVWDADTYVMVRLRITQLLPANHLTKLRFTLFCF